MPLALMLNGQPRTFNELEPEASLADLVAALGLKADRIAVEWNGAIVARAGWPGARLNPGDKLELVHFVGGGSTPLC